MNRELRRAQAKAEAKAEKEKKRARAEKRAKRQAVVDRRKRPKANPKKTDTDSRPINPPGRFATFATPIIALFILLQAATPILTELRGTQDVAQRTQFQGVVELLYYAPFGYFMYLLLMKRGAKNALYIAAGLGAVLAMVSVGAQLIAAQQLPGLLPNLQLFYFGIPAAIAGAFLGQVVWHRAPR